MKKLILVVALYVMSSGLFAAAPVTADKISAALADKAQAAAKEHAQDGQASDSQKIKIGDFTYELNRVTEPDPANGVTEFSNEYTLVSKLPEDTTASRFVVYKETDMEKLHAANDNLFLFLQQKIVEQSRKIGGGGYERHYPQSLQKGEIIAAYKMYLYPMEGGFLHRLSIQRVQKTEDAIIRYVLEFDLQVPSGGDFESNRLAATYFDNFADDNVKTYTTSMQDLVLPKIVTK